MASDARAGRSLPHPCYADAARVERVPIVAHRRVGERTHRLRLACPTIASGCVPGQFAMLRIPGRVDPLLARPLAIYDTYLSADDTDPRGDQGQRSFVDFLYLVHGKFTTALADVPAGAELEIWGPLGNGFCDLPSVGHLALVAGGIGQTALLAVGRAALARGASRVTLCWGARHGAYLADADDFRRAGIDVHLATLDGSAGHRGTVIDLLDRIFAPPGGAQNAAAPDHVVCCGPEPMMAAVARWSAGRGTPCTVSLETPMACGIGICFTCVAPIRDASGAWDYRRTCVEGPVFDAATVVWPETTVQPARTSTGSQHG